MPTYDYRCATCGKKFEWFQSISSDPLEHCPVEACQADDESLRGKGDVQRIVSGGAGLVFKGEGFYLTDYARKAEADAKNGSKSKESSDSSSEKTTDPSSTSSSDTGTNGKTDSGGTSDSGGTGTSKNSTE